MAAWRITVVICLSVCVAHTRTNEDVFPVSPREVSALLGGKLTLMWKTSIPDADINSCYWEYSCSTCRIIQLLAYNNKDKEVVHTKNEAGWNFTNMGSPCRGGIQLERSRADSVGLYRLFVKTKNGSEYQSERTEVKLYKESNLSVSIDIFGIQETVLLRENVIKLKEKQPSKDGIFSVVINFNGNLPTDTKVSVTKYSGISHEFMTQCIGDPCEIKVSICSGKDISLTMELDTGIQDFHIVKIIQPFETNYEQDSLSDHPPIKTSLIMFAVLFALLFVLLLVYVILLCVRWRGKKTPSNIKSVMMIWKKGSHDEELEKQILNEKDEIIQNLERQYQEKDAEVSKWQKEKEEVQKALTAAQEKVSSLEKKRAAQQRELNTEKEKWTLMKQTKKKSKAAITKGSVSQEDIYLGGDGKTPGKGTGNRKRFRSANFSKTDRLDQRYWKVFGQTRAKRSALLKQLLEESSGNQNKRHKPRDEVAPKPARKMGHPKLMTRRVGLGMRLACDSTTKQFKQIKSPLGDKSCVNIQLMGTCSYDEALYEATTVLFPNGKNRVIGNMEDYDVQLVNVGNENIKSNIEETLSEKDEPFTLDQYMEIKKITSLLRLHLLCIPKSETTNPVDSPDDDDVAGNGAPYEQNVRDTPPDIPDLVRRRNVPRCNDYMDATFGGEVQFRVGIESSSSPISLRTSESYPGNIDEANRQHVLTSLESDMDSNIDLDSICDLLQTDTYRTEPVDESGRAETTEVANRELIEANSRREVQTPPLITSGTEHLVDNVDQAKGVMGTEPTSLQELLLTLIPPETNDKRNCVNIVRKTPLDGAYRAGLRSSWNPNTNLSVLFLGEAGMDDGGLQREFLSLVVKEIFESAIFHGADNSKYLALNASSLERKEYLAAGKLLSFSLVHGGKLPNCIALALYNYIVSPDNYSDFPPEAVPASMKKKLEEISSSSGPIDLQGKIEEIWDIIEISGCTGLLQRPHDLHEQLLKFLTIGRMKMAYEQFFEGLSSLGVLDAIRSYPDLMRQAFTSQGAKKMTAIDLINLFVFSEDTWSPIGSNKRLDEARIHGFFLDFLLAQEDNEAAGGLSKVLSFCTGAVEIPVLGFHKSIDVFFRHPDNWDPSWDYPTVSTCALTLGLPLVKDYATFTQRFTEAMMMECFTSR